MRTSVSIDDDIHAAMKKKNINISGALNDLATNFVKNDFSMDFGNNKQESIKTLRNYNFVRVQARKIDKMMVEILSTNFTHNDPKKAKELYEKWKELMERYGITQANYAKYVGLINE